MTEQTFKIQGMHCTACAHVIEKTLRQQPGVQTAVVDYGTATAKVDFDKTVTGDALNQALVPLGYALALPTAVGINSTAEGHII